MHAKSGLRVLLEWKINRSDSVITAVIRLGVLLHIAFCRDFTPIDILGPKTAELR